MSVEYESENPIAPLVDRAMKKGVSALHQLRMIASENNERGDKRFPLDVFGERDPMAIYEYIKGGEIDSILDELYDIANHGPVVQQPGRQPKLEYYVGGLKHDCVKDVRPMVNIGCGPEPPKIHGVVNYDPYHNAPNKGLYYSNGYTDSKLDQLSMGYAKSGAWLSEEGYSQAKHDVDAAKCSRAVLQKLPPEELPVGDHVDIVPNYKVWVENGKAQANDDGTYQVCPFSSVGGLVEGLEYDHSKEADAVLDVGWHHVLFFFYTRIICLKKKNRKCGHQPGYAGVPALDFPWHI